MLAQCDGHESLPLSTAVGVDRYLHVGGDWWNRCGAGWVNIDVAFAQLGVPEGAYARDAHGRKLLHLAVTNRFQRLPFPSNSIQLVYSEHMIEHVLPDALGLLLREVHRVLAPGGIARFSTPDLAKYMRGYRQVAKDGFLERHARRFPSMQTRGDRNAHVDLGPPTRATVVNNIFRNYGHQWIYDHAEFARVARAVNITEVCASSATELPTIVQGIVENATHPRNASHACWLEQPIRAHESLFVHVFKRHASPNNVAVPKVPCVVGREAGMQSCPST